MSDLEYTFLRQPDVLRRTGHRESTLYRLIRAGQFPRPVQISDRGVGWPECLVNEWCRAKMEGRTLAYAPLKQPVPNPRVRVRKIERVRA